jgi:hypothetical protein
MKKSTVLGMALLTLALISQGWGQASKRVIYYYQTLTDLSPIINNLNPNTQKPFATDINLSAFHLGHMSDGTLIHLNKLPPDDATFNTAWQQLGQLQSMGVSVHMMLGGAAQGSYSSLFGDFNTFYPVLKQTIQNHKLNGVDLDVEESVSLSNIEMLINQLRSDFGSGFQITLAPVATDVEGGGGLSGFDYGQLFHDLGSQINWFNVQYYSGFGSLSSTSDYDNAVSHGFPPNKLVAGMLGSANDGGGFVDVNTVANTVKQLVAEHPDFGGVDCWQYFDAMPGGQANPQQWSSLMTQAMATSSTTTSVQVNLSSAFNVNPAIVNDGTTFSGGGLDGGGRAYSAKLLGAKVSFGGAQFNLGQPNAANGVTSSTVALPAGKFSALSLVATGLNGNQPSQTVTVKYSDGTTSSFTQSFSDWAHPQNFTGESIAVTMSYRDNSDGTTQVRTVNLYGYTFAINGNKTVSSVALPNNVNVVVLAMNLSGAAESQAQANLAGAFNITSGIVTDGTAFSGGGLDGGGRSYSANLLGTTVTFNGISFNLGPANGADVVSAKGQTITLPSGQFSSLKMLATGVNGNQSAQALTVTYTDGTTSSFTQSFSDWVHPQSFTGESIAVTMAHRDNSDGTTQVRTVELYNYDFALNGSKTVSSITLPSNTNVEVLAITLVP